MKKIKSMLKYQFILCFAAFLVLSGCLYAYALIAVGSTKKEVIEAFGEPSGVIKSGKEEILSYPGGMIVIVDGKVDTMDANFTKRLEQRKTKENFEKNQKEKGLVPLLGQWVSKGEKKKYKNKTKQRHAVIKHSNGGVQMSLNDILVPEKITIVDFYADWCPPCRQLSPYLEKLAKSDTEVYLRKIDIVKWGTPITRQFSINSIPDVRVFDQKGRMIGKPTYDFKEILSYVKKCK